jgi:hypothetical protein
MHWLIHLGGLMNSISWHITFVCVWTGIPHERSSYCYSYCYSICINWGWFPLKRLQIVLPERARPGESRYRRCRRLSFRSSGWSATVSRDRRICKWRWFPGLQETHVPKSSKQRSFAGTESSNMAGRRTLPDSRGPTGIPLALNLCLEPHPEQA